MRWGEIELNRGGSYLIHVWARRSTKRQQVIKHPPTPLQKKAIQIKGTLQKESFKMRFAWDEKRGFPENRLGEEGPGQKRGSKSKKSDEKRGRGRWEVRRGQCDLTSLVQLNPLPHFLPYFPTFQILLLLLLLILLLSLILLLLILLCTPQPPPTLQMGISEASQGGGYQR